MFDGCSVFQMLFSLHPKQLIVVTQSNKTKITLLFAESIKVKVGERPFSGVGIMSVHVADNYY